VVATRDAPLTALSEGTNMTLAIITNILFSAVALIAIVGLIVWAIVTSRPRRRPAIAEPRRTRTRTRARVADRRPPRALGAPRVGAPVKRHMT
jgi:hypothetical protein